MKRLMKWAGLALAVVLVLAVVAAGAVYAISSSKLSRTFEVPLEEVAASTAAEVIAEGGRLFKTRGCSDCHGEDGGGAMLFDEPALGTIGGQNLTTGRGGVGAERTDAELVAAIRHGVHKSGRPLVFMPSHEFQRYSDADTGALVAYMRSIPAVDREMPPATLGPIMRMLLVTGEIDLAVDLVDHPQDHSKDVQVAATLEYGKYLGQGCIGCHGEGYSGGKIPGTPPEFPAATNITPDPASGIANWTQDDFFRALRSGKRPDGSDINPFMPWRNFRSMNDVELEALWKYISTLPPRAGGTR